MNIALLEASLLAAVTGQKPASDSLLHSIQPARDINVGCRLEAYRANVMGAHLHALEQAFPVTREVLGARYWRQLLQEEIKSFESTTPDLHAYGEFVPKLLIRTRQHRPELRDFPYLGDLATLEWQVHCARFAPDDLPFDWGAFKALPPERQSRATLTLSRAFTIFRSKYPVDVIWYAHQAKEEAAPDLRQTATCCIHRINRFDVTVTRLNRQHANLLVAIRNGIGLENLAEAAEFKEPGQTIQQLYDWIRQGWIVGFEVK